MATSKVEISNLALSWLAGNPITSLDDDSVEARLCKANYAPSRRAVLESREWTFAVDRVQISRLVALPIFGYSYQFLKPTKMLYSIGVYDPKNANDPHAPQIAHVFEDDYIMANIQLINVKYIIDQANTKKFTPLFDQALAAHLAMNIAIPLTENKSMFESMFNLFNNNLDNAAASDGLQGTRERLVSSRMEKSRQLQRRIF